MAVEIHERYVDGLAGNEEMKRAAVFWGRLCAEAGLVEREETGSKLRCDLLRDIFGNPFRPVALDPAWLAWRGRTIPKLARAIYDERAFDRLPILADALEEAGCTDADLLGHLRLPAVHVRGCFAVDAVLRKE
jgi:hypothetical protein